MPSATPFRQPYYQRRLASALPSLSPVSESAKQPQAIPLTHPSPSPSSPTHSKTIIPNRRRGGGLDRKAVSSAQLLPLIHQLSPVERREQPKPIAYSNNNSSLFAVDVDPSNLPPPPGLPLPTTKPFPGLLDLITYAPKPLRQPLPIRRRPSESEALTLMHNRRSYSLPSIPSPLNPCRQIDRGYWNDVSAYLLHSGKLPQTFAPGQNTRFRSICDSRRCARSGCLHCKKDANSLWKSMMVLGCYRRALSPVSPPSLEEESDESDLAELNSPVNTEEVLDIAPPEYSSVTEKIFFYDSSKSDIGDFVSYDTGHNESERVDLSLGDIVLLLPPGYESLAHYPVVGYTGSATIDLKSPVDVSLDDTEEV